MGGFETNFEIGKNYNTNTSGGFILVEIRCSGQSEQSGQSSKKKASKVRVFS